MQTDKSVERPLHSLRVIEFEGIGPGPLAGRMLSDLGAHVILVARPTISPVDRALIGENAENPLRQGKEIIVLDLKTEQGVGAALDLVADADALIEGNRPGVMERLGLGPGDCAVRNPRLVYGRMTGWGQSGPLAQAAGHDLNYIALTGLLSLSGRLGTAPIVPPTVLGDAAGALGLCFGVVSAVLDARSNGRGRVVDAAIVDVVAMLGTLVQGVRATARSMGRSLVHFTILLSMMRTSARTAGSSQSAHWNHSSMLCFWKSCSSMTSIRPHSTIAISGAA